MHKPSFQDDGGYVEKLQPIWANKLSKTVTIQVCLDRGRPVRKGRRDVCDPAGIVTQNSRNEKRRDKQIRSVLANGKRAQTNHYKSP
jgi:hypothetical protein